MLRFFHPEVCEKLVGGSNPLKNISQNGNLPQVGVTINNIWNHHLVKHFLWEFPTLHPSRPKALTLENALKPLGTSENLMSRNLDKYPGNLPWNHDGKSLGNLEASRFCGDFRGLKPMSISKDPEDTWKWFDFVVGVMGMLQILGYGECPFWIKEKEQ